MDVELQILKHLPRDAHPTAPVIDTTDARGQITLDTPLTLEKNSRVEVIVLIPEVENESDDTKDTSKAEILEDFRQAWHEAMTGKTIPASQIWEGIEDV